MTFTTSLVAKLFYPPWRPKWSQLGALLWLSEKIIHGSFMYIWGAFHSTNIPVWNFGNSTFTVRVAEWHLEKRGSRKILAGSRNLGSVFDKSRSLVFSWFVFTFFESRNFSPKSLRLGFLTRILASRQVSDFTIRHFSSGTVHSCYTDPTQATVRLVIRDLRILRQERLRVQHFLYTK